MYFSNPNSKRNYILLILEKRKKPRCPGVFRNTKMILVLGKK
jgi:hypothetical protein